MAIAVDELDRPFDPACRHEKTANPFDRKKPAQKNWKAWGNTLELLFSSDIFVEIFMFVSWLKRRYVDIVCFSIITFTQESAETLQEFWCSYNQISSLDGVDCLKNLEVLYMSNNTLSNWAELDKLKGLSKLRDVLFVGNPIYEGMDSSTRRYPCPLASLP